jgi:hypothetical protein
LNDFLQVDLPIMAKAQARFRGEYCLLYEDDAYSLLFMAGSASRVLPDSGFTPLRDYLSESPTTVRELPKRRLPGALSAFHGRCPR